MIRSILERRGVASVVRARAARAASPSRMLRLRAILRRAASLAVLAGAAAADAQQPLQRGDIHGRVIDFHSGAPLRNARVVVSSGDAPGTTRSVLTDSLGRYRLGSLPSALYQLRAELVGYRPGVVWVELQGTTSAGLSVALEVSPIAIEPIRIFAPAAESFGGRSSGLDRDSVRVGAERLRQQQFLSSDAISLTHADVEEAPSLGESDVLRALQRRSGVSTRDDYTSEVWTRGAPWDLTSVQFDGVPLFNPMHAVGAVSVFSTEALAEASFHPGVQPLHGVAGAAGLLEMRSRSGFAGRADPHSAELSLLSARVTSSGYTATGGAAWMVSARRAHLDLTTGLPYTFADAVSRVDVRVGQSGRLELSGLLSGDVLSGGIEDVVEIAEGRWGGHAGRVTMDLPAYQGRLRTTLGASGYASSSSEGTDSASAVPMLDPVYRAPTTRSSTAYRFVETVWTRVQGPARRSTLGARLFTYASDFTTEGEWPFRRQGLPPYSWSGDARILSAWGEGRWPIGHLAEFEAGLRTDVGPGGSASPGIFWSPRLAARVRLAPQLRAAAGLGRTHQYAYSIEPATPDVDRIAFSRTFWVVAGGAIAPVRSGMGTLGIEYGPERGWVGSFNVFARHSQGIAAPDPERGRLEGRAPWVAGDQHARGAEAAVRKISGRWTGTLSYSHVRADAVVEGVRFSSSSERRHVANLTAFLQLPWGLRAGGSYGLASGEPFTRGVWNLFCDADGCERGRPFVSRSGVSRGPMYQSLDVLFNGSYPVGAGRIGFDLQLRNVLQHENQAAYRHTQARCRREDRRCDWSLDGRDPDVEIFDSRLRGLPFVPFLTVRASF